MKYFAALYEELDRTTKTSGKVGALKRYFETADAGDAAWAVYFLGGRKLKRLVQARKLGTWAAQTAGVADWLFDKSNEAVGDLAETIALLLPPSPGSVEMSLSAWVEKRLLPLQNAGDGEKRAAVLKAWKELPEGQRFMWNKLITGTFRVGVSLQILVRALAELGGIEATVVAGRLAGAWRPSAECFERLLSTEEGEGDAGRPMPFFLACPLEGAPEFLGDIREWQAEWKWDGIRVQLIRRGGKTYIWSRAGMPITDEFPEIQRAGDRLPEGMVVDGEILPYREESVLPFSLLQKRLGRKRLEARILREVPVALMAFDLLEWGGADIRAESLSGRRGKLEGLLAGYPGEGPLLLSPVLEGGRWDELTRARGKSRDHRVEGLMLKRKNSPYRAGRHRGDWWKWKVNPLTVDAVLMSAQAGHGKRAGLYTDYTFGVWHEGALVPVAKACSGLTDAEIRRVDSFIRRNTLDQFGPVRTVRPEMVFEIAFEGIARSSRHKSGVAVRFPRIARLREKPAGEADTLETVLALLPEKDVS